MTFVCPGCRHTYPLQEGQMVIDAGNQQRTNRKQARADDVVVAILCALCTAEIVLARAGH